MSLRSIVDNLGLMMRPTRTTEKPVSLDPFLERFTDNQIQHAQDFLDIVLKERVAAISRICYVTGYTKDQAYTARDILVHKGLIKPVYLDGKCELTNPAYKLGL